jgi:hypothetical protein
MHVTWWHGVLAVFFICLAIWEWIAYPRRTRQLRDGVQSGIGSRAEAIFKQRRRHKRLRWLLLIGAILVPLAILGIVRGDWDDNIDSLALGLFSLATGAVALVCLRILDPVARAGES